MSILQTLRSATTHAGTCQARSSIKTNLRVPLRRNYTAAPEKSTPPPPAPAAPAAEEGGSNPLLWIGCLSLGVAYTYYEKKQKEKLAASLAEAAEVEEVVAAADAVKVSGTE